MKDANKNSKWKDTLLKELVQFIGEVDFGPTGVELLSSLGRVEPIVRIVLSTKKEFISRWQIVSEIHRTLSQQFQMDNDKTRKKTKLQNHFPRNKIETTASALTAFFSSLPRKYVLLARLPRLEGLECTNLRLTNTVAAIEGIAHSQLSAIAGKNQLLGKALENLADLAIPYHHKTGKGFYLKTEITGYGSTSFDNLIVTDGIERLKQTIYLLHVEGVLNISKPHDQTVSFDKAEIYICDINSSTRGLEVVDFPESLKAFLGRLYLNPTWKTAIDEDRNRFEASKGKTTTLLTSPDEPKPYLYLPEKMQQVVDFDTSHLNVLHLKNALTWAFDSTMNQHDRVMSFIQLSIALEALLGADSEKASKTSQLADRCAMIVGRNREERVKIRKEFVSFYNIRSALVHGSMTKLDHEVSVQESWGEWILRAIMRREILFSSFESNKMPPMQKKSKLN